MASTKSKCIYPFPVLIIRDASSQEWREPVMDEKRLDQAMRHGTRFPGTLHPIRQDVRLSFYQAFGKPWDWQRAHRVAAQFYPGGHGAISIEWQGVVHHEGDAKVAKVSKPSAAVVNRALAKELARVVEYMAEFQALTGSKMFDLSLARDALNLAA